MKKNNFLLLLLLVIPYLLIFKSFFLPGHLVAGDAPFFYPENLKQLFDLPLLWNFKNENFGASQSVVLWLYLPTYLYGLFHQVFNLNNDFLIRVIFYFPATILSLLSSWIFLKRFIKNPYAILIGAILYSFNTYFITIIDGGVVGLALAYGLFPLVVLTLLNYLEKGTVVKFAIALFFAVLISNIDLRLALISWILAILLLIIQLILIKNFSLKYILRFFSLLVPIIFIDSFWLIPLSQNIGNYPQGALNSNNFIKVLDALVLFSPHFPENDFGRIVRAPIYSYFILILLSGALFLRKEKQKFLLMLSVLYLIFAFLTKGQSDPLGSIYSLITNFPLGGAFRDSTKFFTPLALIGAILVANTVEALKIRLNTKVFRICFIVIYFYILVLIYPAFFGQMSGVLGNSALDQDFQYIAQKIQREPQFFRTLWITEKPQMAYTDWQHPGLSGNTLYQDRPFASMNIGKFDLDNFIYDINFPKWLDLLGVQYVFLSGNIRSKEISAEQKNREKTIFEWMQNNPSLEKLNWPLKFSAFKVNGVKPYLFVQENAVFVLGSDDIYDSLFKLPKFSLANQGFIFLEEGRVKPSDLATLPKNSIKILLNKKSIQDLAMFFLQDKMISPKEATKNQWMKRESQDYLSWKYDLLRNHIESKEFDYQKGIAFSTVEKEEINFDLKVKESGKYYLGLRYTNSSESAGLNVIFNNDVKNLKNPEPKLFKWDILGPYELSTGINKLQIINLGGFVMVNTLVLVSDKEFEIAQKFSADLINNNEVIQIEKETDYFKLLPLVQDYNPVSYKQINPTEYNLKLPESGKWLVFSDHYNKNWMIKNHNEINSLPFYAMVNGFYIGNVQGQNVTLIYQPQEQMPKWIMLSVGSLIIVVFISGAFLWRKKK